MGKAIARKTQSRRVKIDEDMIEDLYAFRNNIKQPPTVNIPSTGPSAPGLKQFLLKNGDRMMGALAFNPADIIINATGHIDISPQGEDNSSLRDDTSYVLMTGAGTPDDLNWIDGAQFNGQLLVLQGTASQVLNIIHATTPGTDGNIVTADGTDIVLDGTAATNGVPVANFIFDVTVGGGGAWRYTGGSGTGGGGGGNQTPWLQNVDADGWDLFDLSNLEFRTSTGPPTGQIGIWHEATGLHYNTLTGQEHILEIDDVAEYQFGAGALDFNGNNAAEVDTILFTNPVTTIASISSGMEHRIPDTRDFSFWINNLEAFTLNQTELNVWSKDILNIDRAVFVNQSGSSFTATSPNIYYDAGIGLILNNNTTEAILLTHSNIVGAQSTADIFQIQTPATLKELRIYSSAIPAAPGVIFAEVNFRANRTTGGETEFAKISGAASDTSNTLYEGQLDISIMQAGTSNIFMRMNQNKGDEIDMFRTLNMTGGSNPGIDMNANIIDLDTGSTNILFYLTNDNYYYVRDTGTHRFFIGDSTPAERFRVADIETTFRRTGVAQLDIWNDVATPADNTLISQIDSIAETITGGTDVTYTQIQGFALSTVHGTAGAGATGQLNLRVTEAGSLNQITYISMNGTTALVRFHKDVDMLNGSTLDMNGAKIIDIGETTITDLSTVTAAAGDFVWIIDATDGFNKKVDANDFLGGVGGEFTGPMTADHDYAGWDIRNLSVVELQSSIGLLEIQFHVDTAVGDNQEIGAIRFMAQDATPTAQNYARITGTMESDVAANEDGSLKFFATVAGVHDVLVMAINDASLNRVEIYPDVNCISGSLAVSAAEDIFFDGMNGGELIGSGSDDLQYQVTSNDLHDFAHAGSIRFRMEDDNTFGFPQVGHEIIANAVNWRFDIDADTDRLEISSVDLVIAQFQITVSDKRWLQIADGGWITNVGANGFGIDFGSTVGTAHATGSLGSCNLPHLASSAPSNATLDSSFNPAARRGAIGIIDDAGTPSIVVYSSNGTWYQFNHDSTI